MAMQRSTYSEIRDQMRPGDVIAFGGKSHFSELIKVVTRSGVSHVGVVLQTQVVDEKQDRYFNQVIESTSINDFSGVVISRLSDRLAKYKGDIWWLPLSQQVRAECFDSVKFYNFLFKQARERKEYDLPQALFSAADLTDKLPFGMQGPFYNTEDFDRFFCSELVAAGLEEAGTVGKINASEVTPIDLCRWKIFGDDYCQLQGEKDRAISRYNSLDPADWDV